MSAQNMMLVLAGFLIMLSVSLAHVFGQTDISQPNWLWMAFFFGLNQFQAGLTGFCPLRVIFRLLGFS